MHLVTLNWFRLSSRLLRLASLCLAWSLVAADSLAEDPLPSWQEGAAKRSIIEFVQRVTQKDGVDFVPIEQRIATFDNDGTLWSEQPVYFQLQFAMDRVRELASQHPEWKGTQPFQAVLENDKAALAKLELSDLAKLVMVSHAGMTNDEFAETVRNWLAKARHPRFERPYHELVYQPMLELLAYLRAHQFKTYIVSGGGIEFLRVFAEEVYGIPPEQVVGSTVKTEYRLRDGVGVIHRLPEIDFVDDKAGKPVAINRHIARRPLAAFGNSDGDLQMLQYTSTGAGPRFCLFVRHTDAKREWAYDRDSHIGRLDQGLLEAQENAWTIVDMARDWKVIYPPTAR